MTRLERLIEQATYWFGYTLAYGLVIVAASTWALLTVAFMCWAVSR